MTIYVSCNHNLLLKETVPQNISECNTRLHRHVLLQEPQRKRSSDKVQGKEKTSSKKKKKTNKRALRPLMRTDSSTTDSESKTNTGQPQIAHGNRVSISMAYAENSKARNDLFKQRLDQEKNKENIRHARWIEEQKATQRENEATRRHELLMTLVQQGKSAQEIDEFLRIAGLKTRSRKCTSPLINSELLHLLTICCVLSATSQAHRTRTRNEDTSSSATRTDALVSVGDAEDVDV